jgi:hypothetical protein
MGGCRQEALSLPLRKKIEQHADDEQRDRKMNQYHVLRVLREKYRL